MGQDVHTPVGGIHPIRRGARAAFKACGHGVCDRQTDIYTVPSKYSKKTYTQWQHAVLIYLKIREEATYRGIVAKVTAMPQVRRVRDLTTVPHHSSLCKAFDRLAMAAWRRFFAHTRELVEENGVVAADASGFDRSHASRHYTKRTDLHIQQLKVTLLVDAKQHAVVDVHVTTTRKHDTTIAPTRV